MIQVPVYSEQPLTPASMQVLNGIIDSEWPKNTFDFVDASAYVRPGSLPKVLVFGSVTGNNYVPTGAQLIYTYSIAQMMTKPNAASVIIAALQQFVQAPRYSPIGVVPLQANAGDIRRYFDLDKPIAVDIETSGNLDKETPEQVGIISIAFYQPGSSMPMVITGSDLNTVSMRHLLMQIKKPIFHNGKFDMRVIEAVYGVKMQSYFDTMLAHHVLNQGAGDHKLKTLARRYLGAPEWEKDLSKYTVGGAHYERIPIPKLVEYNGWDVFWTYALYEFLAPQIEADEKAQSAYLLEMAAANMLIEVEQFGFKVDIQYADQMRIVMEQEVHQLLGELQHQVGPTYNPSSWQQTKAYLNGIGHYANSTNEESLLELVDKNPKDLVLKLFVDTLLEYRQTKKALKTYVMAVLDKNVNGRVHTTFLIHGTTTGRLSSSGPNIQNIPRLAKYRNLYIG